MTVAKQLYQLQETDLQLEANEQAQHKITGQLGASREVARLKTKLTAEQQRLEELQHQQHSIEWEIDDLTTRITATEEKLYGGKITNPKELTSFQQEDDELKTRRSQLEDKALEIMEQVESTTSSVSTVTGDLKKLEAEWQSQQQQLSADLKQLKAAHADLTQKQETQSAGIDPRTLEVYRELRKRKGTAIARVEQGTCRGCQIALPVSDLQQARSGSLVRCDSCERILFLP